MFKLINTAKGAIFIVVMLISMLMIFIGVSTANMLLQDVHMIKHLKYSTQAQYLAEAGLSDALATLVSLGFSAKDNPANFPQKALADGTYDVTVTQIGERVLLSSVGMVSGVSRTAALEVKDNTPTSLYYMMSSGSDFSLRALVYGWADINGNAHSNRNMNLQAWWNSWIDIDTCGASHCDGSISASGTISISQGWGGNVTYHGSKIEGAAPVTFPNFDYAYYKNLAIADGYYYTGNKTFNNATLNPPNGIVYVEGGALFRGINHIYGGIVADYILVFEQFFQHKKANRNVIIARSGDIQISYRFETEEALVYSARDFRVFNVGFFNPRISITGILIAARYFRTWDLVTQITYKHKLIYPDGLIIGPGGVAIEIVSWNK